MRIKVVVSAVVLGLVLAGRIHAQKVQPAIAGRWVLNAQRSDKLPETLRNAGGIGSWGGVPAAPPAGDPLPEGEEGQRQPAEGQRRAPAGMRVRGGSDVSLLLEARRPPLELVIELTDTTASVVDETGRGQVLPTTGRRVEEITAGSRTLKTKAEWKDRDLRVEKQISGVDTRLRYTFRFDEVTGRLTVLLRLETGRAEPIEVRLVYDRAEPVPPPASEPLPS